MKPIEWRVVTPEESDRINRENDKYMPDELRRDCDYCGVGRGFPCLTRGGNWAATHAARMRKVG